MTDTPKPVQVVTATDNGIHAIIYGKNLSWNKAKDQYFALINGKWKPTTATARQQQILKERQSAWAYKEKRIANAGKFRKTHDWFDNQAFKSQERNA